MGIDPTELFFNEKDPATTMKNAKKVAFEDIGEAVSQFLGDYIAEKIKKLDDEASVEDN